MTKLVVRVLSSDGGLLGWTEIQAAIRGDGCVRARGDVVVPITASGFAHELSMHWCDVNTDTRVPLSAAVLAGDALTVCPAGVPMIVVGPVPVDLPPVTVGRSVAVSVPVGAMGAKG